MEVVSGGVSGDRVLARPLFLHHLDGMNLGKSTICGHSIAVTVNPICVQGIYVVAVISCTLLHPCSSSHLEC